MAFSSVSTKVTTAFNATEVVQVLSGGAGNSDVILTGDLTYGTAQIVVTSGTAPTNIQLQAGNDGIAANMANVGNAVAIFPAIFTIQPSSGPFKFIRFVVTGGDATTVVTITCEFMGTRG